jgi:hypothetical protein
MGHPEAKESNWQNTLIVARFFTPSLPCLDSAQNDIFRWVALRQAMG